MLQCINHAHLIPVRTTQGVFTSLIIKKDMNAAVMGMAMEEHVSVSTSGSGSWPINSWNVNHGARRRIS